MAFADMFAPMRNFGATAAATTQANAALMGAQAAQSRAKTAKKLAPWNMGATAVQGIGTIGGLTQKFMEMEQMRPQREAMTGYYEALTQEKNDPVARLQKATELGSQFYNTLLQKYWNNGLQPPLEVLDMMESGVMTAYGAKKAPAGPAPLSSFQAPPMAGGLSQLQISPQISAPGGLPARTTGGVMPVPQGGATALPPSPAPTPSQWLWPTDMDPEEANLNRKMAETIVAGFNFGPSEEDLKTIGEVKKAERDAKLAGLRIDEKTRALLGDDRIAYLTSLKAAAAGFKQIGEIGIPVTANSSVLRPLAEILMGRRALPQETTFDILTQVTGNTEQAKALIKNMNAKVAPRAAAGTGVPLDIEDLGTIQHQQQLGQVAGDVNPQEEALKFAKAQEAIARGETGEATDPAHQFLIRRDETPPQPGAVTMADNRRQAIAEEVWGRLGSPEETAAKMNIVKKRFPFLLKELGEGKLDSRLTGSRQKLLVIDMLLLRAGHSPFQARNLWKNHLDVAAGLSGLTGEAREAFKQKITHNLNRMSSAFGPISEGISEEEIATKGGVGQVPHATQGDILRQGGWGGEGVGGWLGEMGATAMSGFGNVAGGGYGGNRQELEAVAALLREPSGGRVITPTELKGLFKVGGTSGYLTFDDTFYRTTDLVAWEIDANLKAHIDENEGAGLDFWQAAEDIATQAAMVGVGTARVASAGAKALGGIAKLPGVSHVVKGAGRAAGPKLRSVKEALFKGLGRETAALEHLTPLERAAAGGLNTLTAAERASLGIHHSLPQVGRTGGLYKKLIQGARRPGPLLYEEALRRGLGPRGLDWYGSPAEQPLGE